METTVYLVGADLDDAINFGALFQMRSDATDYAAGLAGAHVFETTPRLDVNTAEAIEVTA